MADVCSGSLCFPTNFDGEHTICRDCGRTLKLAVNGLVPSHKPDAPRVCLLPRGEAIVDGRKCGG